MMPCTLLSNPPHPFLQILIPYYTQQHNTSPPTPPPAPHPAHFYHTQMGDERLSSNVRARETDNVSVSASESAELSPWKRAWSVQSIIALLCLVCILLTASATEVMNTVTCDSALEDTRDTMDRSTRKLSTVAEGSLSRVSTDMMTYITNGVERLIHNRLEGVLEAAGRMNDVIESEFRYDTKNDTVFWDKVSARLLHLINTTNPNGAITAMGIFGGDWGISMADSNGYNLDRPELLDTDKTSFYMTPNRSYQFNVEPITGLLFPGAKKLEVVTPLRELDFIKMARAIVPMDAPPIFPIIGPISTFVGFALTSRRKDRSGSIPGGLETCVFVGLRDIERFLQQVTQSAIERNPDAIMRAYTTVASTYAASYLGAPYEQAGFLTGASAGESTQATWDTDPMMGWDRLVNSPLLDVQASDVYIRAIAIKIDGNYSKYDIEGSQTILINVTGHNEEHFVSVERIRLQDNGLDWWLTVSIDANSILGDVQRSNKAVNADIVEDKQEVADEVEEKKMLQRGIIIGIGALLVVLSAITSWYLLRPVKAMQRSMELVANMELDEIEIVKSTFYELRLMQRDFRKMIENLVEFRAYVPSSVLESSGYSGEGGKTVVAPPTGHVAIVFTDIRGSTALWKCSAEHMNVAMEIHNEVMRDACVAHKGYEVKTIGDAFMVSFACPFAAANFALDVQTNLVAQKWPEGLELPEAGLVVRIGINYGPTIAEENPVTGRVDYRGSTVNLASRVEAKALPGTVCITTDMYAAIKGSLDKVGNPKVSRFGIHEIKGLGNGHELFLAVPAALQCRLTPEQSDTNISAQPQSDAEDATEGGTIRTGSSSMQHLAAGGAKKTALHLQKTSVTVAVCRVCPAFLLNTNVPSINFLSLCGLQLTMNPDM